LVRQRAGHGDSCFVLAISRGGLEVVASLHRDAMHGKGEKSPHSYVVNVTNVHDLCPFYSHFLHSPRPQ
jgi:hypothetical protein